MVSLYFYLFLLALIFTAFGFLLCAFYFDPERVWHGAGAIEKAQPNLAIRQIDAPESPGIIVDVTEVAPAPVARLRQEGQGAGEFRTVWPLEGETLDLSLIDAEIIRLATAEWPEAGQASKNMAADYGAEADEEIAETEAESLGCDGTHRARETSIWPAAPAGDSLAGQFAAVDTLPAGIQRATAEADEPDEPESEGSLDDLLYMLGLLEKEVQR